MCDICSKQKPKGLQFMNCYKHRSCRTCVDQFKMTRQPLLTRKSIGIRLECPVCTVAKHAKDNLPRRSSTSSWKASSRLTCSSSGNVNRRPMVAESRRNQSKERATKHNKEDDVVDDGVEAEGDSSDDNADLGGGNEELEEILAPKPQPAFQKLLHKTQTSRNPGLELQLPQYQRKSSAGKQEDPGNLGRFLSPDVSAEVSQQVKYEQQDTGDVEEKQTVMHDEGEERQGMHNEELQTEEPQVKEEEKALSGKYELTEDQEDVSLERKMPSFHLPSQSNTSIKASYGSGEEMLWARHSYIETEDEEEEEEEVAVIGNDEEIAILDAGWANDETNDHNCHGEEPQEEELERGTSPCKATRGHYTYGWILSEGQRKCPYRFAAGDDRVDDISEEDEDDNDWVGEIEGPEECPSGSGEWECGILEPPQHPGIDPNEPELPADCRMILDDSESQESFWKLCQQEDGL